MQNEIFITQDGSHSVLSGAFGVPYHSKYGAIQETQHVFIEAALYPKIEMSKSVSILEIGFGTGLNALMTLLEAHRQSLELDYHTFEKFPISMEQAQQLNYPTVFDIPTDTFLQLHQCDWNTPTALSEKVFFTKWLSDFHAIDFQNQFDIIYFDAFAPNAQADLWEADLLSKMYAALKINGVLTTYCAKGVVKRCLRSVGFEIEAIPGPPGKREMTRAWKK